MAQQSRLLAHNFDVAAATMYLWDYLLTFELERDLVWTSKWNFIKVLFLVQRYLPLFDTVFLTLYHQFQRTAGVEECRALYEIAAWTWLIGTMASEMLLTLRVWAVWHQPRVLTIALPILFTGVFLPCFVFSYFFNRELEFSPKPFPEYDGCFITGAPGAKFVLFNYMLALAWDTFILILIAIPGFHDYFSGSNSALMKTIYRDGVSYYIYLAALSIVNVIAIQDFQPSSKFLLISMERIFHSILASRVLLHIRFQASHNSWTVGLTDLQWGQVSHLSDFIGLDQISPENDPPTKVEPHFLQQGGLSEVGKELFSASGSTNCPPRRISTSNFIGSFTSR